MHENHWLTSARCMSAVFPRWLGEKCALLSGHKVAEPVATFPLPEEPAANSPPGTVESLVDEMVNRGRYTLLLRPQIIDNLTPEERERAVAALNEGMCLVPGGDVALDAPDDASEEAQHSARADEVRVEAYYLDRFPITNRQFRQFLLGGGYEQMAIWDAEIWPAVLDFVDSTGHPGPRFWQRGCYMLGEENHPVVGISWYEAEAYSRWVGKRLPTDAEWVKAGSWPVAVSGHPLFTRTYPWGEAMDRRRANLWGSGPGRTVSVQEFADGASVGGVRQLIGNVWEWTAESFVFDDLHDEEVSEVKLKSIRGGAFDTYLDCQATCQFQSGDRALARKHNVGFRCAISLSDLATCQADDEPAHESLETTLLEA
jgi:iron(II)-dependent oxidoreductase